MRVMHFVFHALAKPRGLASPTMPPDLEMAPHDARGGNGNKCATTLCDSVAPKAPAVLSSFTVNKIICDFEAARRRP